MVAWLGVVDLVDGDSRCIGTAAHPVAMAALADSGGEVHSEKGAEKRSVARWRGERE
jgi:hypothetical protein